MSDVLSFNPNRALTANIDAAAAARAFFYDAGTTTLRTVYADSALTIPHASPLVANAAGIFPAVYVDGSAVKVVAQDAAGATLYTLDPCVKVAATGATAAQVSFAPSTAAPYTNVQDAIDDLAVLRNSSAGGDRIINGDMSVWQRGTSSAANGYVAADRWQNARSGGTATLSQQSFALGDVLGVTAPEFFLRQAVSGQTAAGHYALISQRIEDVRAYAGQAITILGWAKRSSGTGNMAVDGAQNFGTGGSPSALVTGISPTTVTLTGTWAPFAIVMAIPSVTGKTLGTFGDDYLGISFWTSAGTDLNARTNSLGLQAIGVDLWGIHIRAGTWTAADAALYRPRDPGTELALCQRYYEITNIQIGFDGALGAASASTVFPVQHRVIKRATPNSTVGAYANLNTTVPTATPRGTLSVDLGFAYTNGTGVASRTLSVVIASDAEL